MSSLFFCTVRVFNAIRAILIWLFTEPIAEPKVTRYLLSDEHDSDDYEGENRVPENAILVEEWLDANGNKKCNLFYEGEDFVTGPGGSQLSYDAFNPFIQKPRIPWVWIGDKTTEVDLTEAMRKYMVVGNVIRLDLILHMIQVRENTEIVYIDARTMDEVKFPADGVRIVADDSAAEESV
jgi:hypothetical protein